MAARGTWGLLAWRNIQPIAAKKAKNGEEQEQTKPASN